MRGRRMRSVVDVLVMGHLVVAGLLFAGQTARAQPLVRFDFTQAQDVQAWQPAHDIARLEATSAGLLIEASGEDPYIHGPARDYPAGQPLWLRMRIRSVQAGTAQVFYFTAQKPANEPDSVRFTVQAGSWEDIRVELPPLGPGYCLRFDPPGGKGNQTTVASLTVEARNLPKEPVWPVPAAPVLKDDALTIASGDLELVHNREQWGGFVIRVAGQPLAAGLTRPLIGYVQGETTRWLDVAQAGPPRIWRTPEALFAQLVAGDADGAEWMLTLVFTADKVSGALDVLASVKVSQPRQVVFLPMFVVLPGLGSFGQTKHQAFFAGLEYLDQDEPSSSEADLVGPGSKRQVPDTLKITLPLMAIQHEDRYVGLLWKKDPRFSALFDSPDRVFKSGAHVMGLLFPGSDGTNRAADSLLPYQAERLKGGDPMILLATLIGGRGASVVPAIQQFIALHSLPPAPQTRVAWDTYAAAAAAGWLDSAIRVGNQFRHAWPGGFNPQPAADAAMMMDWLALQTSDTELKTKLKEAAKAAVAEVPAGELNFAGVSHVRYPAPALVYGHAAESGTRAQQVGRDLLKRFEPDGSVRFKKTPDGLDYGKTHSAPEADGLTAQLVVSILEAATVCGDPELIRAGLRLLRALDKFDDTVPRGAQTWEIPLHTPDILAAAHLVRAYTLGYELTGEPRFLQQARYWAWTGVPFVYLDRPTLQPIGLYATIPVLGATQWTAPNWMGLPVQWCGLVYADALYRLVPHDPTGPWKQLADGITASGVQQTWPRGGDAQRQGLLPDSFALRQQIRNDAAINPGTLLANAVRLFDKPPLYDFHAFRAAGVFVHAPGAIRDATEETGRISFTVEAWPDHPYQVLIVGLKTTPSVKINGQDAPLSAPHEFDGKEGRLILTLEGKPSIELK